MATPGLLAPEIHCPDGRLRGAAGCIRGGLKAGRSLLRHRLAVPQLGGALGSSSCGDRVKGGGGGGAWGRRAGACPRCPLLLRAEVLNHPAAGPHSRHPLR